MLLTAAVSLAAGLTLASAAESGKPAAGLRRVEKPADALLKAGDAKPRIESGPQGQEHSVLLPAEMQQAVQKHDADFKIRREADYLAPILAGYRFSPEQTPFAVIGDFNGDGVFDAVLMGRNETHDLTLVVLSRARGGFRVVEASRGPRTDPKKEWYGMEGNRKEFGIPTFLTLVKRQKLVSPHEDAPLDLAAEAFQVNHFEKAAVVRYFGDCEFQSYTFAD